MSATEITAEIRPLPKLSLLDDMRAHPGSLLLYACEWAGIVLLVIGLLTAVFLLCVGGYSLVKVTPG